MLCLSFFILLGCKVNSPILIRSLRPRTRPNLLSLAVHRYCYCHFSFYRYFILFEELCVCMCLCVTDNLQNIMLTL